MKKNLVLVLLMIAIGANAQTKVKSTALADSIWIVKGGYEISPTVVNLAGDTARSAIYNITFSRDTTSIPITTIMLFDKHGGQIVSLTQSADANTYENWASLIPFLDNFIQNVYKRIVKL